MSDHKTDPASFPALGRMLLWADKPGSVMKLIWALAAVCLALFAIDFTYEKHGYFEMEHVPGFFGAYGFVMFTGLILVAKALRVFIKRPEDFYGDKAIDREEYPEAELGKVDHDD